MAAITSAFVRRTTVVKVSKAVLDLTTGLVQIATQDLQAAVVLVEKNYYQRLF